MAIDFRKMMLDSMTPEKREHFLLMEEKEKKQKAEAKRMTNEDFSYLLEYIIINCFSLLSRPNSASYEGALAEIYLPEVLRRLRQQNDVAKEYNNQTMLQNRVKAMHEHYDWVEKTLSDQRGDKKEKLNCGCTDGAHPNSRNYLAGTAEREGLVCKLGWNK